MEATTSTLMTTEKPSTKEVLKNSPFMVLFAAQFIENIGRAVSGLAVEFLIYELTGSPLMMGILSIIWLLPFVVIAPFAGVYTDRFDQRKLMLYSNIVSCIASVGFVIIYLLKDILTIEAITTTITGGITTVTHSLNYIHVIWPLYLLCFINSAAAAFFFPARSAYTRLIVKKKNLLVANSIGSTVFQIATIVGFLIAGVLAEISYLTSFIFDASTFLVSGILIGVIFFIGKKPPKVERKQSENLKEEFKDIGRDIVIGYRTIREYPKISYMLLIFSMITFSFGAVNVLFIVILQGEMGLGQTWYGLMQAAMGASGIIMALILMVVGKIRKKILMLNIVNVFATISMYLFSVVRNRWAMLVIMFAFGVLMVGINVPSSTLIQETIPYEKQGRVFGTQQLVQGIAQMIGMGVVSMIAEYVQPMYVLLASSGLFTVISIFGFIYSAKRNLMSSDYVEEEIEVNEEKLRSLDTKVDSQASSSISLSTTETEALENK